MTAPPVEIRVPEFGHGLDEALLVEWVAPVGSTVARGDIVAEVETVKAGTQIIAERPGRISAHEVGTGTIIRSGDLLYRLDAE